MIIALKNTIDAVMNHNQMGKITISEFNAAASEVLRNIQASLFPGFRKLNYRNMRLQATTNYGNEAFFLQQAMEHYVTEKEVQTDNGKLTLSEQIEDFFLVKEAGAAEAALIEDGGLAGGAVQAVKGIGHAVLALRKPGQAQFTAQSVGEQRVGGGRSGQIVVSGVKDKDPFKGEQTGFQHPQYLRPFQRVRLKGDVLVAQRFSQHGQKGGLVQGVIGEDALRQLGNKARGQAE